MYVVCISLSPQDFGVWDSAVVKNTKWTEPLKSSGDFEPGLLLMPPGAAADVDGWVRAEELRICSSSSSNVNANANANAQGKGKGKGSKQADNNSSNSPVVVVSTNKVGQKEEGK